MRTIYSILIIILTLASCSKKKTNSLNKVLESNDTSILKEKKIELDKELQKLNKQINQLNEKLESLNPDKKIPLITIYPIEEEIFTHYLELQGNVKTKQNVLIYPEVSGLLQKILVEKGQQVVVVVLVEQTNAAGLVAGLCSAGR